MNEVGLRIDSKKKEVENSVRANRENKDGSRRVEFTADEVTMKPKQEMV